METYIGKYCIIRSDRAGVFAGNLSEVEGSTVKLTDSRRLWYWSGAASLSELAQKGVNQTKSKFPCAVPEMIVLGVIEIIPTTQKAEKSIKEVKEWTA